MCLLAKNIKIFLFYNFIDSNHVSPRQQSHDKMCSYMKQPLKRSDFNNLRQAQRNLREQTTCDKPRGAL